MLFAGKQTFRCLTKIGWKVGVLYLSTPIQGYVCWKLVDDELQATQLGTARFSLNHSQLEIFFKRIVNNCVFLHLIYSLVTVHLFIVIFSARCSQYKKCQMGWVTVWPNIKMGKWLSIMLVTDTCHATLKVCRHHPFRNFPAWDQ